MEIILKYFKGLTDQQVQQFAALEKYYQEWNAKINVISRKDIEGLYEKHVLHSLSIAVFHPFQAGTRILDIGTGGGFPGIPLAIFFPGSEFLLVDSIAKKLKVVEAVAAGIGLHNISVRHGRAEDLPVIDESKFKKFDLTVSRAVAPLKELWHWSRPLLDRRSANYGGLICLKGGDLREEIKQSQLRPKIHPLSEIFSGDYFKEKYLLQITG